MDREPKDHILLEIQANTEDQLGQLAKTLGPFVGGFKIGIGTFARFGPLAIHRVRHYGQVFADLKFHDIPSSVEEAAYEIAKHGIQIICVHCAPGTAMMAAALKGARSAAEELGIRAPKLIGVTVLSSHTDEELADDGLWKRVGPGYELWPDAAAGYKRERIITLTLKRAGRAHAAGLDGVVASAECVRIIREEFGKDFLIVTPGIRFPELTTDDQARTGTPGATIAAGADYIVVRRMVMEASNRMAALERITRDIADTLKPVEAGEL